MTTFEITCTEPGRWDRAPDAEASASEILAYLQHCDACAYHARLVQEQDSPAVSVGASVTALSARPARSS